MKCPICKKSANDLLSFGEIKRKILYWEIPWSNDKYFCRNHAIEELMKIFFNYSNKMIVFYPEIEAKGKYYGYAYITLEELKLQAGDPQVDMEIDFMERNLHKIEDNCMRCGNFAQIAYFNKGILKWKTSGPLKWEVPLIGEIYATPEIICLKCCFNLIEPPLRSYRYSLDIDVPYEEDGMLYPLKL